MESREEMAQTPLSQPLDPERAQGALDPSLHAQAFADEANPTRLQGPGAGAGTRAGRAALPGMSRFAATAAAVLGIAVLCSVALFASRPGWGVASIACFVWSAACALGLGWVGFQGMTRALTCTPSRMPAVMLLGFLFRGFLLIVSQLAAYAVVGPEWGHRVLIATTVFYLLVLGVEVHTLNQLFHRSRSATRQDKSRGEPGEGTDRS